jgi:hypothetical protein
VIYFLYLSIDNLLQIKFIESQVSRSEIIKFKSNTPATYIFILILVWKGTRPMYYLLTAGILILILNSSVIGNLIENISFVVNRS